MQHPADPQCTWTVVSLKNIGSPTASSTAPTPKQKIARLRGKLSLPPALLKPWDVSQNRKPYPAATAPPIINPRPTQCLTLDPTCASTYTSPKARGSGNGADAIAVPPPT